LAGIFKLKHVLEAIIKGIGLGLIFALSVGPVIFTILKQSINNGQKGGFSFVIGVWLSDLMLVFASNVFSDIVVKAMHFKTTIGYIGAAFIISMGAFYLFFKKVSLPAGQMELEIKFGKKDITRAFMSGLIINTLNPSVILFWLINATAFAATNTVFERVILFSTCLLVNMIGDVAKVMMASKIRHKLTVHNINIINKISGLILVGFGVAIIYGIIFLNK
jgi:threonine/homoserine/homoserine lactone efflux protein